MVAMTTTLAGHFIPILKLFISSLVPEKLPITVDIGLFKTAVIATGLETFGHVLVSSLVGTYMQSFSFLGPVVSEKIIILHINGCK